MLLHFYFLKSIENGGWEEATWSIKPSDGLLSATLDGDEEKVAELIEQSHQDNTSLKVIHKHFEKKYHITGDTTKNKVLLEAHGYSFSEDIIDYTKSGSVSTLSSEY